MSHILQVAHHSQCCKAVKARCRLIKKQYSRISQDASSNAQPPPFTTRETPKQQAPWQPPTNLQGGR